METVNQKELGSIIENFDFGLDAKKDKEESLASNIVKILSGSSRTTRLGSKPTEDTLQTITENVSLQIEKDLPIFITSAWGAIKTLELCNYSGIDLAELFTVKQYIAIHNAVEKVYPPGICYRLYLGDSYYEYLYGENHGVDVYCEEMQLLAASLQYDNIQVIRTSLFHEKNLFLYQQCNENLDLLRNYWYESHSIKESKWEELSSFQELKAIGWAGTIPSVMRDYYLKRMDTLLPELDDPGRVEAILKFFSYGLMIKQNDFFGRANPRQCTADFCLMRMPPPGMPKNLHGNRLRIRYAPVKISKRSAPPWTVMGILAIGKDGEISPKILSFDNYDEYKFVQNFRYEAGEQRSFSINVPIYKKV